MKETIHIDSVFLSFGNQKVLRGIYLELERNQITGILGRNGSGKSCLLKIITGQLIPQSKYLSYQGQRIAHIYKEKGLINYLPQHECHPTSLCLKDMLRFYEIDSEDFVQIYPFLQPRLFTRLSTLSEGERRLWEVLVVLESPSAFTILDEPFSYLMPKDVELIKATILRLTTRKGIILTDHQYKDVLEISDQLFLLRHGIIEQVGGEEDLRDKGYV